MALRAVYWLAPGATPWASVAWPTLDDLRVHTAPFRVEDVEWVVLDPPRDLPSRGSVHGVCVGDLVDDPKPPTGSIFGRPYWAKRDARWALIAQDGAPSDGGVAYFGGSVTLFDEVTMAGKKKTAPPAETPALVSTHIALGANGTYFGGVDDSDDFWTWVDTHGLLHIHRPYVVYKVEVTLEERALLAETPQGWVPESIQAICQRAVKFNARVHHGD